MRRVAVCCGVAAVMLAMAFPAAAAPARSGQTLFVRSAQVAPRGAAGRIGVKMRALINDSFGDEPFTDSLLHNTVVVSVTDSSGLHASIPITGCAPRKAGGVVCTNPSTRTFALAIPLSNGPYAYLFRMSSPAVGAGGPSAGSALTVTVDTPGAAQRVDVISDCKRGARNNVLCRDHRRPNIILVMTDDQRPDTVQYMPRLISLIANRGVTFTNSFVTTPNCCPSRTSTLNGQYAHNHRVLEDVPPDGGAPKFVGGDRSTIATWLQQIGYRTGMYGKYLLSYNLQVPPRAPTVYIPPGWDEWHVFVTQGYFNYKLVENGTINAFGSAESDYSTDVLFAKAVDFINSAHGQPFFLHLGTAAPHSDGALWPVPAPRHADLFGKLALPQPPNYDEADVSDKPPWVQALPRAADPIPNTFFTYEGWTWTTFERELQTLQAVDEGMSLLMSALDATGQTDNTIVIYTSDNGLGWEEHRWYGKGCPYEECLRVPLLIRAPQQVHTARQESGVALNIDLAPTIAALTGAKPASAIDGQSLVPLLEGHEDGWRNEFEFEYFTPEEKALTTFTGVRTPQWKYDEYKSPSQGAELYDLTNDPYELQNRVSDPAYAAVVEALRARLAELSTPRGEHAPGASNAP